MTPAPNNAPVQAATRRKLKPDPIRPTPLSKFSGCGPHRSYRHLHHQRGTIGTFHVRLLEGRKLSRTHWSALSLGPVKHLGLSRAHGEVSSFGTLRLAFWRNACDNDIIVEEEGSQMTGLIANSEVKRLTDDLNTRASLSESSLAPSTNEQQPKKMSQHASFMPSTPSAPKHPTNNNFGSAGKSPLMPLFQQGCIRSFSPVRSPFFPCYTPQNNNQKQQINLQQKAEIMSARSGLDRSWHKKPLSSFPSPPNLMKKDFSPMHLTPLSSLSSSTSQKLLSPPPPHHYAKEQFKSSTVHNDSNPIWGDSHRFFHSTRQSSKGNNNRSTFRIPLQKDDLLPTLLTDGVQVGLEVRLDEEMAPTESLLVGGALSTAVGAATAATSVVGMERQAHNVSTMGMEMLGLGADRLIGRGCVDLMPLLLGAWEENWEQHESDNSNTLSVNTGEEKVEYPVLNEYGRIDPEDRVTRRRMERMGMLDVWVPLYHPTATTKAPSSNKNGDDNERKETSGEVHLLISYEPNGMPPKRDDIVAFESFARRPHANNPHDGSSSPANLSTNTGPVIAPIVPPLSPLVVVETCDQYLLLEYATCHTVTSVDRAGNVRSSRWERSHRVRIHRHAVFVIERQTLMDAAGIIARLPGDVVLSTKIGQDIAEALAPIVAGAVELMGPALLWGKLMLSAGGTGARAGLAGARAATKAVVLATQEKGLERREWGGTGYMERGGGDAGVYSSYGE